AEGETVSEVSDGEEFYLHVPADPGAGVATVHARAGTAALSPGRAFSGRDGVATLPVVAAEEALTGASAEVKADWSASGADGGAAGPDAPAMPEASSHAPVRELPEAPPSPAPSASPSPAAPGDGAAGAEASDGLALTGTWLGGLLVIGGGLVAAGAAAVVAARLLRRR
ncbi:TQXA domain-containing protein, partial [Nocardiopsis sp. RSe5-2]|nr:TQXA domain-containing protein [Nocardiopsis endophytica]